MHKLVTFGKTASPEGVVGPRARLRALVAATILALAGLVGMAMPATAGPLVDPDTLQPPPLPGAECRLDGAWIICQTSLSFTPVNEPILDIALPCGTMYLTGSDVRSSISGRTRPGLGVVVFENEHGSFARNARDRPAQELIGDNVTDHGDLFAAE